MKKGQARHPTPVVLLARLAVDKTPQGRGVGPALLKDALIRTARAADTIGARALLVHAKDETARSFYEHFGFDPSPTDPLHLFLIAFGLGGRMTSSAVDWVPACHTVIRMGGKPRISSARARGRAEEFARR